MSTYRDNAQTRSWFKNWEKEHWPCSLAVFQTRWESQGLKPNKFSYLIQGTNSEKTSDRWFGEVHTYMYLYWLAGIPYEPWSTLLSTPTLCIYMYQKFTANHMPDKSHMTLRCTAASSSFLLLIVGSRTVFICWEDSCIPFHDGITMAITRESSVFTTYQNSTIQIISYKLHIGH